MSYIIYFIILLYTTHVYHWMTNYLSLSFCIKNQDAHICTQTHAYAYAHAHTHTCTRPYIRTHIHKQKCARMYITHSTYTNALIHPCICISPTHACINRDILNLSSIHTRTQYMRGTRVHRLLGFRNYLNNRLSIARRCYSLIRKDLAFTGYLGLKII